MATHASAEKRNRQRVVRTERNRAAKSQLKTEVKKARLSIKEGATGADEAVRAAVSSLDSLASKGRIPAKRASRLKSRLASALHKAKKAA